MTRRVRVLRRAQADLLEIQSYIKQDNPRAARDVIEAILGLLDSLGEFSERGSRPRDAALQNAGHRSIQHGEYLIFYKVLRAQIRVYRIVHGRRRYKDLL